MKIIICICTSTIREYRGLEKIKEKLKETASSSDYIKSLAEGYTSVTEKCVVEVMQLTCSNEISKLDYHSFLKPFAEAARKGAKRVFKRLNAEMTAANMLQLEENFEKVS